MLRRNVVARGRFQRQTGGTMARSKNTEQTTLSVKDFGPIAEATVELRPLTILVGASNTGKSYLAILLYALHRFFGAGGTRMRSTHTSQRPPANERLEKAIEWFRSLDTPNSQNRVDFALPDTVAALVRPVLEDVGNLAPLLDAEIGRCFGVADTQSLIRHSGRKAAQVALRRRMYPRSGHEQTVSCGFTVTRSQAQFRVSVPADVPLRVQVDNRSNRWFLHSMIGPSRIRNWIFDLADLVLPYVVGTVHRPVHYLPADRAGVMHAHRVVVSSLIGRASHAGLGVESPLPALSGVLADFLERLIELGDAEPSKGVTAQLAEQLEEGILKGAVGMRPSAVGYPSFHYRPANWKTDLALMNTSSMVSELAPVVLYLRHVVRPGDVLVIEEPESHLHPAMQVALTRFLALVVHKGIRIVVTTHSEWVLETLANLVRLSKVDKSRRKEVSPDGLALTPDQVGAWLFERRKRPNGSVVKEIPLDVASGTFPAGFNEVTAALYNNWAGIANLLVERGR